MSAILRAGPSCPAPRYGTVSGGDGGERPMAHEPRILEPQCEWTAADVADEAAWTELFDADERAELDAALRHALAKSDDVLVLGRDDFPLPTLAARLARIERELID